MMKSFVIVFLSLSVVGCSFFQKNATMRQPQAAKDEAHDIKVQNSFARLMNAPTDGQRSQATAHFLDRQRDFYYIAQGLLNSFDEELEKLYHLKTEGIELTAQDKTRFFKASFQMRVAREFSERNLHEILGIYQLALAHANDSTSKYHTATTWIVKNISKWLDKGWEKGDQSAIISLAEHLDDVNNEFTAELKESGRQEILVPSFAQYSEATQVVREQAFQQSLKWTEERKQTLFDSFIAKEWLQYAQERSEMADGEMKDWMDGQARTPQALDNLKPDAGSSGNVTGNRFPQSTWALTFDDGPHPKHTLGMYQVLQNAQMSGTFFWLSQNIIRYPAFVQQAKKLKFNLASHSYSHANLPKLNQAGLNKEINEAADVFAQHVGSSLTMFRCPYGACGGNNSAIRQMIASRDALHIAWNVDTLDWQDKNAQSIFERTKKQIEVLNHGIILFHDIHAQSVEALALVTQHLKQRNYKVKPLPEIISEARGSVFTSP